MNLSHGIWLNMPPDTSKTFDRFCSKSKNFNNLGSDRSIIFPVVNVHKMLMTLGAEDSLPARSVHCRSFQSKPANLSIGFEFAFPFAFCRIQRFAQRMSHNETSLFVPMMSIGAGHSKSEKLSNKVLLLVIRNRIIEMV